MSQETIIAWTHHTFNLVWGCTKVSPGCAHCYAETLAKRYGHAVWGDNAPRRVFGQKHWDEPLAWDRGAAQAGERRRAFCGSICDWAEDHETVNIERAMLWPLIKFTPNLDWLLLTKRPERIASLLPSDWGDGYPNVWLGTSIENNAYAGRADHLRVIPAVVRFISYEPALGPLDQLDLTGIDWVIYGGESGNGFRPHDLAWPRQMYQKCLAANVAFFFKQSSAIRTEMGTMLDGKMVRDYPTSRQIATCDLTVAKSGLFA